MLNKCLPPQNLNQIKTYIFKETICKKINYAYTYVHMYMLYKCIRDVYMLLLNDSSMYMYIKYTLLDILGDLPSYKGITITTTTTISNKIVCGAAQSKI